MVLLLKISLSNALIVYFLAKGILVYKMMLNSKFLCFLCQSDLLIIFQSDHLLSFHLEIKHHRCFILRILAESILLRNNNNKSFPSDLIMQIVLLRGSFSLLVRMKMDYHLFPLILMLIGIIVLDSQKR